MSGKRQPIPKAPSRITGLDEILEGGLPQGRTTVISGGPGSGKTVAGLEFLCRGAMAGEPGVFVTFEERAEAVRLNASAMGWDLTALEKAGKIAIIEARLPGGEIVSGDFDIQGLLAIVGGHVKRIGDRQIVMDALDVLLRVYDNLKHERNELSRLHDWLTDQGLTSVLSVKTRHDDNQGSQYEFLDFMADCVIRLDHRVVGQVATRRLRVIKYRGSGFGTNEYPYVFGERDRLVPPDHGGTYPSAARDKSLHGFEGTGPYVGWRLPARILRSYFGQQRHGQDHVGVYFRTGRLPTRREGVIPEFRGIQGGHDQRDA